MLNVNTDHNCTTIVFFSVIANTISSNGGDGYSFHSSSTIKNIVT